MKISYTAHPAKIDLDKKWLPKQKTIQEFNIDARGFKKRRNENLLIWEVGAPANPSWLTCQPRADRPALLSW